MTDQSPGLVLERAIQPGSRRHTVNGETHVLHCHHYSTLYTQLAEDATSIADGPRLLREAAEDAYRPMFDEYFRHHGVRELPDRISVVEQWYASAGLGRLKVNAAGPTSGEAVLLHSHLDEGWISKWGKRDRPVNYLTAGYLAAGFAACFDRPARTYTVNEVQSIVAGAAHSLFTVVSG